MGKTKCSLHNVIVTNENGVGKLYILDTQKQKNISKFLIYQLDGNKLAFVINTPKTPGDIFGMNLNDNNSIIFI